ncbi:MAG: hypothetical protein ACP5R2_13765, partial [Anaerolineae bacterium]
LQLSHNGMREPSSIEYFASTALSSRLIRILTAQLHGTLNIEEGGVTFIVTFPAVRADQQDVNDLRDQVG